MRIGAANLILILGILVLFLACVLSEQDSSGETTWYVDDDGGRDFTRIQHAVDNSSSGDTIRVYAGNYYENVEIDKSVNVLGDGSSVTMILGERNSDVVIISKSNTFFEGFGIAGDDGAANVGIKIEGQLENTRVENTTIDLCDIGIYVRNADNCVISNNTVQSSSTTGIYLSQSDENLLANNQCNGSGYGYFLIGNYGGLIIVESRKNSLIGNNIHHNSDYGIYLYECEDHYLRSNRCTGNTYNFRAYGPEKEKFLHDIDDSNTVNNKPILYLVEETDLQINDQQIGYLGIIDCKRISVFSLEFTGNREGAVIAYSEDITIHDSLFYGNEDGLYLRSSSGIGIRSNIIRDNDQNGIFSRNSKDSIIEENSFSNNDDSALELVDGSNMNFIANNTISGGSTGIKMEDTLQNTIEHNTLDELSSRGVSLTESDRSLIQYNNITNIDGDLKLYLYGIDCSYSDYVNVKNNNIQYMGGDDLDFGIDIAAIRFRFVNHSIISRNMISSNNGYGIWLQSSDNNNIHNNSITKNNVGIFVGESFLGTHIPVSENRIHFNDIMDNDEYGLSANGNVGGTVDARNNWWGSSKGPSGDGPGKGDEVWGDVEYKPWLSASIYDNGSSTGNGEEDEGSSASDIFAGAMCMSLCCGLLIVNILILIWVYKDAEKRGESGTKWLIIVFFLGIIGLIIWLIVRPKTYSSSPYSKPKYRSFADTQNRKGKTKVVIGAILLIIGLFFFQFLIPMTTVTPTDYREGISDRSTPDGEIWTVHGHLAEKDEVTALGMSVFFYSFEEDKEAIFSSSADLGDNGAEVIVEIKKSSLGIGEAISSMSPWIYKGLGLGFLATGAILIAVGANQVSKNPGTKETQTQSNLILDFGEESRTGKKGKGGQSGADISDILGPPIPTNQMIQPPGPQQIMGPVPPPGIYQPPMQQAQTVQFNNPPIPIQSNQAYQGPMQPHIPQQQSNLAQQPQLPIQPVQPHHIRMQPYPQQRPPLTGIPGPVRESVQVQQPAPQMQQQIQVPGRSQPSPPTMTQYQSASWICPNCGTNVDANYSFCMSCGHKKGI